MEFSTKSGSPQKQQADAIAVGVFESGEMTSAALAIDAACEGALSKILKSGDMSGKVGSCLPLYHLTGIKTERVLLVGLGKAKEYGEKAYLGALKAMMQALSESGAQTAECALTEVALEKRDLDWALEQAVLIASECRYRFDTLKSKVEKKKDSLKKLSFSLPEKADAAGADLAVKQAAAIASGIKFAKDLANLPGNICTPTHLAESALALAKTHKLKTQVLEQSDMKKLKMGSLLAVAQGSHEPAKLIVLEYHGAGKGQKPIALVGKGITFDSGGISLKPGADMDEMKYDMCGAASVLGAIKAAAAMQLELNIVAIIPATENMPGGSAVKPGDIVTSMSGQTIEILNTDAEGRLILCDALTYAERFNPETVVDVATLTGACVIALGHVTTGLFANDDELAAELLAASEKAYDRAWRLPIWDDYQEQLKSNFADMANIGGRPAGSITAACFLSRFAKDYRWAHLDIAGTANLSGKQKGATGRPVGLLAQFLIGRANRKPAKSKKA